ncbi:MAG: hypothetical protein Q9227_001635 [Pyrenula ochraceoflavens]
MAANLCQHSSEIIGRASVPPTHDQNWSLPEADNQDLSSTEPGSASSSEVDEENSDEISDEMSDEMSINQEVPTPVLQQPDLENRVVRDCCLIVAFDFDSFPSSEDYGVRIGNGHFGAGASPHVDLQHVRILEPLTHQGQPLSSIPRLTLDAYTIEKASYSVEVTSMEKVPELSEAWSFDNLSEKDRKICWKIHNEVAASWEGPEGASWRHVLLLPTDLYHQALESWRIVLEEGVYQEWEKGWMLSEIKHYREYHNERLRIHRQFTKDLAELKKRYPGMNEAGDGNEDI